MPQMLAIRVSGRTMTLIAVSTRRMSLTRCEMHRLVGLLERLDHLLVVLEHVPDPLVGVADVVEVDLELAPVGRQERAA